ncbi:hypothetical protein SAMN05216486_10234 [bacterium JGI 053]|nr:hypothetical protein SAMN05216486_10234 [bacterium JGI 053]
MKPLTAVILAAALAACTPSRAPRDAHGADAPPPPAPVAAAPAAPASSPGAGDAQEDTSLLARLEHEVADLTHAEGCAAGACRTAPIGSRPCGGPRAYIVYCPATTDSVALFAKLAELARAEAAFNRASGMASTCEYRDPPNVAVQGGRCVATAPEELRAR